MTSLIDAYLRQVGLGSMSCHQLGTFCREHERPRPRAYDELGKCVGHNAERDLHLWADTQEFMGLLPPPYAFRVMKHPGANPDVDPVEQEHCALLPHEVFAALAARSPELFEHLMTGPPGHLDAWWAAAALAAERSPEQSGSWLDSARAATGNAASAAEVVPLGMHGDDAGGHGHDKVLVVTWGSVAVDGPTLDTRICFTMLRDAEAVSGITREKLYDVLVWSFAALAAGVFPAADENGRAFGPAHHPARARMAGRPLHPRKLRGVWAELRGDWKYLRECLHLKDHYLAHRCCHLCDAFTEDSSSSDFRPHAPVRATRVSAADWPACCKHHGTSPLLRMPAFNIWRVQFDCMHTVDLGVLQHAIPSALQELCNDFFRGPNIGQRVAAASAAYNVWCSENKVQAKTRRITVQWVKGPWPCISQVHCKASALRHMVGWILQVCQEASASDPGDRHARWRAAFFCACTKRML